MSTETKDTATTKDETRAELDTAIARDARKDFEPIEPGLYLSIARSTIPATNVGPERARRRKGPTRTAASVLSRPLTHPIARGLQVHPPQRAVKPTRRV